MASRDIHTEEVSRYLQYLPAIYQQGARDGAGHFLGRFLLAFEHALTGRAGFAEPASDELGLEEILDDAHRYFDPMQAPAEFLEWLSGWVALTLRDDLNVPRRREFIARAVELYHKRGTKEGLGAVLGIYAGPGVTIEELNTPFQIAVNSRIGKDTRLDGGAPHFFRVIIRLATRDPEEIHRHRQVAAAIIDMEKPAHTHYELEVETPTLQIGVYSRVGVHTLLSRPPG